MASPVKNAAWPAWIERLVGESVRSASGTELPRSRFHCRLDDQPDHLVPERFLLRPGFWEALTDRPLFVNPYCCFRGNGEPPKEIDIHSWPHENFAAPNEMLWVTDPGSGALQPFWLGLKFAAQLSGAQPGDPAPSGLSPEARSVLLMANVLVPENYISDRRKQWNATISLCRAQFQERGYVPVARLIHPFHLAALRRYYRHQIRTGKIRLGDHQSSRRYVAHNE